MQAEPAATQARMKPQAAADWIVPLFLSISSVVF
jgi:hypothetical protein